MAACWWQLLERGKHVLSGKEFACRIFEKCPFGRNWKHLKNVDGKQQPSPAWSTAICTALKCTLPSLPIIQPNKRPLVFFLKGKFLDTSSVALFQNVIISQLFWSWDCLSNGGGLLLSPVWPKMASHLGPPGLRPPRLVLGTHWEGKYETLRGCSPQLPSVLSKLRHMTSPPCRSWEQKIP